MYILMGCLLQISQVTGQLHYCLLFVVAIIQYALQSFLYERLRKDQSDELKPHTQALDAA